MSRAFVRAGRLQGVGAAYRFARIPFVCAAVIALASSDPIGRTLAIALGLFAVAAGIVMNGREILLGRPGMRLEVATQPVEARRAA